MCAVHIFYDILSQFLKFQDAEEVTNQDIADAVQTMFIDHSYNEMFLIFETCQAESMYKRLYSPNVLAVASSKIGENSYSVCFLLAPSRIRLAPRRPQIGAFDHRSLHLLYIGIVRKSCS